MSNHKQRIERLERKVNPQSQEGGVLTVPWNHGDTFESWSKRVHFAIFSRDPRGSYMVTPGMAEDIETWEELAKDVMAEQWQCHAKFIKYMIAGMDLEEALRKINEERNQNNNENH